MGTMKTFNAKDWTPALLVAPDGRTYTPGDHTEHRELLTRGYVVAPAEPEPTPSPVVETEPTLPEPSPPPAGEAKPKSNRRNGGVL